MRRWKTIAGCNRDQEHTVSTRVVESSEFEDRVWFHFTLGAIVASAFAKSSGWKPNGPGLLL
jgi:hypothetical protein